MPAPQLGGIMSLRVRTHETTATERGPVALHLRRVLPGDAGTFLRLEQNLGAARLYRPAGDRAEALQEIRRTCLHFIICDGRIAGTVAHRCRNDGTVEISNVGLQPAWRGRGVARAAMQQVLALHPAATRFDLVTHPENEPALRLYRSLGFRVTARLENCFGDGEPRLRLTRAGAQARRARANKS